MNTLTYLLNSEEPWVVYRTYIDLMGLSENDEKVMCIRKKMKEHPNVVGLINEVQAWPGTVLSSHKSAGQLYHKLSFLAEIGLMQRDFKDRTIIDSMLKHVADEGLFQLPVNIPLHFGGTGQTQWAWALCDAPLLLWFADKMGMIERADALKGVSYLANLVCMNGWPCVVSKELGNFRGPGKKADPCPYATLIMLKLMLLFEEYRYGEEAEAGVECLLSVWKNSKVQHPYQFYMGTDFRKLKAPFIWYDILHVVEVLSQYKFAISDQRLLEMVDLVNSKKNPEGLYTPESIWTAWKEWDFGQKKIPSAWLTFLLYRINKRLE